MSRHPYTHAADMIRCCPGISMGPKGVKLSRCEASLLIDEIAKAIGMTKEDLSVKLSEYYQINSLGYAEAITDKLKKDL